MRWTLAALAAVAMALPAHGRQQRQPAFARALAPQPLRFPRDRGPHPDYRQEWWYLTGNLDSSGGQRFGFELTLFRFALAPGTPDPTLVSSRSGEESSPWRTRQIYLGHFAVTDVATHRFRFTTKLTGGALGLAGAQADPFRVWIGNWQIGRSAAPAPSVPAPAPVRAAAESTAAESAWQIQAAEDGYVLSLTARPLMAPVLNGERGLSRKSGEPGNATYYYSIPRIAVAGTLVRNAQRLQVHGLAWLDREWGSGGLGPQQSGWDWFGLQLSDGSCLMFYSLRDRDGAQDPFSAGTWVDPAGHSRPLSRGDVRIEVLAHWTDPGGTRYPSRWRLVMPALGLDVTVSPVLADQELVTSPRYWEGAVDVSGSRSGRTISGRGYVELVGYAGTTSGPAGIR
ncbi:MAG TPA: lipocalin-like domain-containing protein [Steroidobacteraceae bacterium]|jgi:predicted secreted hydrolase|nr:lipocalin-like domain-containing protein [Steroidobacteraceae bacterium]